MKNIIFSFTVITAIMISCQQKNEQPKVAYDKSAQTTPKKASVDTTRIEICDLPVQFAGTNVLLFPSGKMRVSTNNKYESSGAGDDAINFKISNNNDNEITGFMTNVMFQTVGQDSIRPLTDKKIAIQSITYLKDLAAKTKKQYLVYAIEDSDTNNDGLVDSNDINSLYLSDINGQRLTKVSAEMEELIDWNLVLSQNRLYFRTIADSNKNGIFDKGDVLKYQYCELLSPVWKVISFQAGK